MYQEKGTVFLVLIITTTMDFLLSFMSSSHHWKVFSFFTLNWNKYYTNIEITSLKAVNLFDLMHILLNCFRNLVTSNHKREITICGFSSENYFIKVFPRRWTITFRYKLRKKINFPQVTLTWLNLWILMPSVWILFIKIKVWNFKLIWFTIFLSNW